MSHSDLEREAKRLRADVDHLGALLKVMAEQIPRIKSVELRAKVEAQRETAQERYEEARDNLEALEAILGAERLQGSAGLGTMGSMEIVAPSQGGAVSAGKTKEPTLFQKALHKRGMSLPEWVATKKKFHLKPEKAKSWVKKPGKGGRPVPRDWASRIAAEFGDPDLLDPESWPNGIRD